MSETKKCKHCGKDISVKYMVCPFCGGYLHDMSNSFSPECPRCRVALEVHDADGEEYNICPKCGGMWLDKGEFHLLTREYDVYRKEEDKGAYLRGPAEDTVTYIPCVRCRKLMNRKNFAKISGVIIDECGNHGVWLDAGELEKIRQFIALIKSSISGTSRGGFSEVEHYH